MNNTLRKKVNSLAPEVLYILTCSKSAELGVLISDRYKLSSEQIPVMIDLVEKIYVKDLRLADLYPFVKENFNFDDATARRFVCDVAGYKLLPVSDWLGEDVANFIRSLGGDITTYTFENEALKKNATEEMTADTVALAEPPELPPLVDDGSEFLVFPNDPEYLKSIQGEDVDDEPGVDDEEEQSGAAEDLSPEILGAQYKKMLTEELPKLLTVADHLFIEQFNFHLLDLLINHEDYKNDLVDVLLTSQVKIGSDTIVMDGRQVEPTAANWLRYFNSQKGSQMFDVVVLSDFLVNTTNTKFLSAQDKDLLSRLLQLYRNIKFFPDSLVGDEPEKWEILTFVGDPNYIYHDLNSSTIESQSKPSAPITSKPTEDLVKPPVDYLKLEALRRLSEQYPANSLERLAVDEEIKRLTDA